MTLQIVGSSTRGVKGFKTLQVELVLGRLEHDGGPGQRLLAVR